MFQDSSEFMRAALEAVDVRTGAIHHISSLDLLWTLEHIAVQYVGEGIRCSPRFLEAFAYPVFFFPVCHGQTHTVMGGHCHLFFTLFSNFP